MHCNSAGLGSKAHLACAALPSNDPGVSPAGNHTVSSKTSWSLAMPPLPSHHRPSWRGGAQNPGNLDPPGSSWQEGARAVRDEEGELCVSRIRSE